MKQIKRNTAGNWQGFINGLLFVSFLETIAISQDEAAKQWLKN